MRHIIKTQVIEFATDTSAGAFELQHRLSTLYYRLMLPLIEKTFDRLAPSHRTVRLDSLSIDLGTLTLEALDRANWAIEFEELLAREVREAILSQSLSNRVDLLPTGIARQWLFYMKHGYLPWNAGTTDNEWYEKVLEEMATDYTCIELLRKLILGDERALLRITLSEVPDFLVHLTEALTGKNQSELESWIDSVTQFVGTSTVVAESTLPKLRSQLWRQVLVYAASHPSAPPIEVFEQAVLAEFGQEQLDKIFKAPATFGFVQFMPFIKKQMLKFNLKKETRVKSLSEKQVDKDPALPIQDEGIFVVNAGLVLLYPFYAAFFKALELTHGDQFKNNDARMNALTMMHFLATGRTRFEEHELVVSKILCGCALEEPVEPARISEPSVYEAEVLLNEVIAQWSILKNTSIEALRESFLQRGGKLVNSAGEKYRLIIAPDSLDVLLDHIPWSFSLIRLPWMEKVLSVEWK
jgi:hypothetical protein